MALFGEKYGEVVRTITIGDAGAVLLRAVRRHARERDGDIGLFLITSEGSAAAGVRRIEAVTGRGAYELVQRRFRTLKQAAGLLTSASDEVPHKVAAAPG